MTELDEWKQAASVEAGLRREFKAEADRLRKALERIAYHKPTMSDFPHDVEGMQMLAFSALTGDVGSAQGSGK